MIQSIIDFQIEKLNLTGYFDKIYCKTELKSDGEQVYPVHYVSNGNWKRIQIDQYNGVGYFRVGEETSSEVSNALTTDVLYQTNFPLRFVCFKRRSDDDAYDADGYASSLKKTFTFRNGAIRNTIKARKVTSVVSSISVDSASIYAEEFSPAPTKDIPFKWVAVSLEIDVTVEHTDACMEDCPTDRDILHAFDFCNQSTFDRLTTTQKTCLTDELCGDADPATLEINGTEIADIPSGGTRDQEVHNTSGTDVGSNNSGEWVVSDSDLLVNGATVGTEPAEVNHRLRVHDDEGQDVGADVSGDWIVGGSTVQNNAIPTWSDTVNPEDTMTLAQGSALDSDGSTVLLANYLPSTSGHMFTCTPASACPSVAVTVYEDAGHTTPITEALFGQTVYVKAVASDITPTNYRFQACNAYESRPIADGAADNASWVIGLADDLTFEVITTDGSDTVADTYDVAVDGFITEWTTWLTGSSNDDQITIPTQSTGSYNCTVDWGDSNTDSITTWNDAAWTHTYTTEGTYIVTITGTFDGFSFNNTGDKTKIRRVIKWGPCGLTVPSNGRVFMGSTNLEAIIGNDQPTLYADSFKDLIRNCSKLYEFRMSNWTNTTAITSMASFAYNANTVKIEGFEGNDFTNSASWSNALRTYSKDMELQNLSLDSITTGANCLNGGEISRANYDATLIAWEALVLAGTMPTGITFHFGSSKYTLGGAAETARTALVTTHSWNITDGGGV